MFLVFFLFVIQYDSFCCYGPRSLIFSSKVFMLLLVITLLFHLFYFSSLEVPFSYFLYFPCLLCLYIYIFKLSSIWNIFIMAVLRSLSANSIISAIVHENVSIFWYLSQHVYWHSLLFFIVGDIVNVTLLNIWILF